MARLVANVDVITDTFEIWLLETNELLHALSTEIITANSTYANTGNSTFSRTAQLYGTFGANNLVVSNWMKGGNVNGQFANLYISTNTVLSNVNSTEIRLEVANGSSNTFMWQYGLHAGLTGANLVANTTKLTVQSNSTTNSTANATLISVQNSTISANMTSNSFAVGISKVSNVEINVGANLIANSTALYVGNSTINSVHSQAQSLLQNSTHSSSLTQERLLVGNSTINALANSTLISIANSTSTANINPISFTTGLFVANTIQVSLGANVTANATNGGTVQVTGSATIGNTTANSSGVFVGNSLNSSQVTAIRFYTAEGSNTVLANTRIISIANSSSSANINPISFTTGIFVGNTTAAAVGANLIANSSALFIGNSIVNSVSTQTSTTIANATQSTAIGINNVTLGNSTVNTQITEALFRVANSTVSANQTTAGFTTGIFTANQTQVSVGANVYANATSLFAGNSTFNTVVGNGSITASANLTITPTGHLVVVGAATVSSNVALANTLSVTGAVTFSNTLNVTGAATLSNTVAVTGAATLSNTIAVTGTATFSNTATFKTEHVVDVFANSNLGTTTGSDVLVFQFAKADYSSAKLLIQLKNAGNTQISEALIAHDTTDAYLTTYGTVSSPASANVGVSLLGTFSANADTTNVRVYVNQTRASSAVKVVAQFIK